jgi:hypothetical protein
MMLVSRSSETDRLIAALAKRGIPVKEEGLAQPPPSQGGLAPLDVGVRFDAMLFRGVAKIAFNYMAWVAGAEFARGGDFNAARQFIRYGIKPPHPVVIPRRRPILADDTPTLRQTNGHLLTLNWSADGRAVIGQVSLFNGATYTVVLAPRYGGIWLNIRRGHHFNLETRRIGPALALRRLRRRPP